MLTVTVQGLQEAQRALAQIAAKQVPFATALALTRTAYHAKAAVEAEVRRVFDRPTPFVQKGLFVIRAERKDPNPQAELKYKDVYDRGPAFGINPVADTLSPQVYGGERRLKAFEYRMRKTGLLAPGYYVTPGPGAKLDGYGNWSRGHIVQVLSYLQQFTESGFAANATAEKIDKLRRGTKKRAGFTWFSVGVDGRIWRRTPTQYVKLHPGIWEAQRSAFGTALRPVAFYVRAPQYKTRLDFHAVGTKAVDQYLVFEFNKAAEQALRTATR